MSFQGADNMRIALLEKTASYSALLILILLHHTNRRQHLQHRCESANRMYYKDPVQTKTQPVWHGG